MVGPWKGGRGQLGLHGIVMAEVSLSRLDIGRVTFSFTTFFKLFTVLLLLSKAYVIPPVLSPLSNPSLVCLLPLPVVAIKVEGEMTNFQLDGV